MPYNKKSYSKKYNGNGRNGHNRPSYARCGKMVMTDASRALAMARHLKSMLNVERKIIATNITAVSIVDGNGLITQLTNIAQGDGVAARDGDQIKVVSLYLRYNVAINANEASTQVRVLIVRDSQTNGAIYTTAQLLETATVARGILSPLNLNNKMRFRVLYDKVHSLSTTGQQINFGKVYLKLNDKLRYSLNAGDITDLRSASYSVVFIGSEVTNDPLVSFDCRIRFVDN